MTKVLLVHFGLFCPIQSISVHFVPLRPISVQFGLFWSTSTHSVHFDLFQSIDFFFFFFGQIEEFDEIEAKNDKQFLN